MIMRKSILFSTIAAAAMFSTVANAQVISIGVQFGRPAPVVVAPRPVVYDDFYYLPEVDAYYSVGENLYYYNDGYNWVPVAYIPGYRSFNWRTSVRYQIHSTRPYMNHNYYVSRYGNRDRYVNNRGGYNNRPDYRGNDRYDNRGPASRRDDDRGGWNNSNRGQDNRYNGPQRGNDDRGRNNQPAQPNRPQGGGFDRPQAQPQRPQQGGGFGQPSGSGRGQGNGNVQPGGRERGGRGEQFTGGQSSNGVTRIARN